MEEQHTVVQTILYHLLPGVLAGAFFWFVAYLFDKWNLPTILALNLTLLIIVIPVELGIIFYLGRKKNNKSSWKGVIQYTEKTPIWQVVLFSILALVWAALIMGFVDKWLNVTTWIQNNLFGWLPAYFDIADIYINPGSYSLGMKITAWVTGLLFTSILGPFVEELYFRGYLMPRISRFKYWTPLIHSILFAVYHFWSLALIPMRVIAILPMNYFVYWKKDIKIGIVTHILLNLIADSIMMFPIFFM